MEGYIHSFETFGTKDGPGIRFVVFMQGCPLRCLYCHNPDTWCKDKAKYVQTPEEVFKEFDKIKNFVRGGITISGGEPMLQSQFVLELLKIAKENNVHTAIDTSGIFLNHRVEEVLKYTDLVLLDLKHIDVDKYKKLTSVPLEPTLKFMDYLKSINKRIWMRYVLVPGYTDEEDSLNKWAQHVSQFENVERIEILPFHQMGKPKWENLNLKYQLEDVKTPTIEQVKKVEEIFRSQGLKI